MAASSASPTLDDGSRAVLKLVPWDDRQAHGAFLDQLEERDSTLDGGALPVQQRPRGAHGYRIVRKHGHSPPESSQHLDPASEDDESSDEDDDGEYDEGEDDTIPSELRTSFEQPAFELPAYSSTSTSCSATDLYRAINVPTFALIPEPDATTKTGVSPLRARDVNLNVPAPEAVEVVTLELPSPSKRRRRARPPPLLGLKRPSESHGPSTEPKPAKSPKHQPATKGRRPLQSKPPNATLS